MADSHNAALSGSGRGAGNEMTALLRRHDPDRFFTLLFAPAERRETLAALYEFNHELARAREMATVPHMALIRLQWWRDVVEGASRRHPVADALPPVLRDVPRDILLSIIDAREAEAEPEIATLADWRAYLLGTAGGLAVAAGHILGAPQPEALRPLGAAYGAAGLLRAVVIHARQGRCLLPADILAMHGLSPEAVIGGASAQPALPALAAGGRRLLAEGQGLRLPRTAIAAALPAVLARRDLARVQSQPGPRGIGDRLAVIWAALTGHF